MLLRSGAGGGNAWWIKLDVVHVCVGVNIGDEGEVALQKRENNR